MWTKLSAACHNVSCDIFFLLLFSIIIWSLSFLFLFASFSYGSSWSFLFFFPVFYSLLVWTTKIIRKQSNSMHSGCTYVEKVQNERQKRTRQCVSTFPEQIFRMSSNRTPFIEHRTQNTVHTFANFIKIGNYQINVALHLVFLWCFACIKTEIRYDIPA